MRAVTSFGIFLAIAGAALGGEFQLINQVAQSPHLPELDSYDDNNLEVDPEEIIPFQHVIEKRSPNVELIPLKGSSNLPSPVVSLSSPISTEIGNIGVEVLPASGKDSGCCGSTGVEVVRNSGTSVSVSKSAVEPVSTLSFTSSEVPLSSSSFSSSWTPIRPRRSRARASRTWSYPVSRQETSFFPSGVYSSSFAPQSIESSFPLSSGYSMPLSSGYSMPLSSGFSLPQSSGWSSIMPSQLMSTFTNFGSFTPDISGCSTRSEICPPSSNCYTPTATIRNPCPTLRVCPTGRNFRRFARQPSQCPPSGAPCANCNNNMI